MALEGRSRWFATHHLDLPSGAVRRRSFSASRPGADALGVRRTPVRDREETSRIVSQLVDAVRAVPLARTVVAAVRGASPAWTDSTTRLADRIAPSWLTYFHSPNRPIGQIP